MCNQSNYLQTYSSYFPSKYWLKHPDIIIAVSNKNKLSKDDLRSLLSEFSIYIQHHRIGKATNLFAFGLCSNESLFLEMIKSNGYMRASKYDYNCSFLFTICDAIISKSISLRLSTDAISYFSTLLNIYGLIPELSFKRSKILSLLKTHKKYIFKTLLVAVEIVFSKNYFHDPSASPNKLVHFSKEEIAEAVSYLIFLFDQNVGLNESHASFINEEMLLSDQVFNLIVDGCILREFQEMEIRIDYFGYTATRHENIIEIIPIDPSLEKSIQLGFLATQFQIQTMHLGSGKRYPNAAKVHDISLSFYNHFKNELFEVMDIPFRRIVYKMPYFKPLIDFLSSVRLKTFT